MVENEFCRNRQSGVVVCDVRPPKSQLATEGDRRGEPEGPGASTLRSIMEMHSSWDQQQQATSNAQRQQSLALSRRARTLITQQQQQMFITMNNNKVKANGENGVVVCGV